MRRSLPSDWLNPICTISTFDANNEVVEIEVLYRHEPQETRQDEHHRQVVVWMGTVHNCHEMILHELTRYPNPEALSVAIISAASDRANDVEKREENLLQTFDSVIFTSHQHIGKLAKLVGTAIISPGDEWQFRCSTWHDVRDIVRTNSRLRPTRYGIGRAKGQSRANVAIEICLKEMGLQQYGLADAEGALLLIRSGSQDLLGKEVKEISRQFREMCGATTLVEESINYDESIDEGYLEVAMFAFGGPCLPQA